MLADGIITHNSALRSTWMRERDGFLLVGAHAARRADRLLHHPSLAHDHLQTNILTKMQARTGYPFRVGWACNTSPSSLRKCNF